LLSARGARVVLLTTSPRVAPGLLTARAWDVLRAASRVLTGSATHPQLPALAEAGVEWEIRTAGSTAELASLLAQEAAAATGDVVWLSEAEGNEALADAFAELPGGGPRTEVLAGSVDLPGSRLLDLVVTMDTLRTGCPWDAKQTHDSLAPHLIEESYEALEALENGDQAALREELGDVLLQVAFHARVAAERTDGTGYTIDDVADGIVAKLVRRHPHVFGEVEVSGADEVKQNWDAIKAAERAAKDGQTPSALDGVPFGQPALALAAQLQRRAERAGIPAELARSDEPGLGEELFRLVARARAAGLDPELELRAAARRYRDRVQAWERSRA
jgi:XTP/dITP diphosphohydrolase